MTDSIELDLGGQTLAIVQGDITTIAADAVSAARPSWPTSRLAADQSGCADARPPALC
jgi:hypothetical protein